MIQTILIPDLTGRRSRRRLGGFSAGPDHLVKIKEAPSPDTFDLPGYLTSEWLLSYWHKFISFPPKAEQRARSHIVVL